MRLLIVCLGNICRSPMGEGALRDALQAAGLAGRVEVDSAGTGDWHVGQAPDRRAIACARAHGVDIAGLRARQLRRGDFLDFDWIVCADRMNLHDLQRPRPATARAGVSLWLPWAGVADADEIADPYAGGHEAFETTWRDVRAAAAGTVRRLAATGHPA
jgi:protein-tyrosine phosphatase